MSRKSNRCESCRSWNGTDCKLGIDGQFPCDLHCTVRGNLDTAMRLAELGAKF